MAIATQEVFAHTDAQAEVWDAGVATPERTLLSKSGRFGVTLTDTEGVARPDLNIAIGDITISGFVAPGVGNDHATAVGDFSTGVATDGTWEFPGIVTTAAAPAPVTTPQSTPVFVTGAGALTLVATDNTRLGVVNYPATYTKAAGVLPVKIGV